MIKRKQNEDNRKENRRFSSAVAELSGLFAQRDALILYVVDASVLCLKVYVHFFSQVAYCIRTPVLAYPLLYLQLVLVNYEGIVGARVKGDDEVATNSNQKLVSLLPNDISLTER